VNMILAEVPLGDDDHSILVEVDPRETCGELVLASVEPGKAATKLSKNLEESLETIKPALKSIQECLRSVAPDELTIDFGLKFGGETGIILAKGTAEVNLKVSMKWKRAESDD
jgi:hypothetical protein